MKHARIIMAMLVLLGAASLAEAQIVVSSTTASTVRPKSGREKGLVVRPELEFGHGYVNESHAVGGVGIRGTVAYQINPYFAFGGGLGYLYDFPASDYVISTSQVLPIFANARAYFIDRKWSPFFDLQLGYLIPLSKQSQSMTYHTEIKYAQGLYLQPTLGVQFKGFDFGIFGSLFTVYYRQEGDNHHYEDHYQIGTIGVSVAYNFQLKKK